MKPSIDDDKEVKRGPGPGAYTPNINVVNKQAPKYVIGTSKRYDFTRSQKLAKLPGPGNYNPNDTFVKTNA